MRRVPAVRLIAALLLVWSVAGGGDAAPAAADDLPLGATLTILSQPVQVDVGDLGTFGDAVDGQLIQVGDVVRTGPDGLALLTFFDGSESQLGAGSQVQLTRAEFYPDPELAPHIAVSQTAGVTVNHVVPMPPGGSFETHTPAATGLVRGTSFVVTVGSAETDADAETDANALPDASLASPPDCAALEPGADPRCVTSVALLADPDGHVGRVDVAALASSVPVVELRAAGDLATASATAATRVQLEQPIVDALTTATHNHTDTAAARYAHQRAREVLQAVAPVVTTPALSPPADLGSVVSSKKTDPGSGSSDAGPSDADPSAPVANAPASDGKAGRSAAQAADDPSSAPPPAGATTPPLTGSATYTQSGSTSAGTGPSTASANAPSANTTGSSPSANQASGSGASSSSGQPSQGSNVSASSGSSGSASPSSGSSAPATTAPSNTTPAPSTQQPAKPKKTTATGTT